MVRKLKLSPKAEKDLEKIYIYTFENWGINQADKYQDILFSGFNGLLEHPKMGKVYEHRSEYRRMEIGKHLVFYKENEKGIFISRILHESMDVDRINK